jgi:hypothetical protein
VGQYTPSEAGGIPNNSEGFGRVDLARTVGPFNPNEKVEFRDEGTALETGEEQKIPVVIEPSTSLLKVTLVWTDPPGETLQNDLDLIVRAANGQERHGNIVPSSMEFDRKNNVEQVIWVDVPAGDVEIVIRAFRITLHPQSYALVVRQETSTGGGIFRRASIPGLSIPDNNSAGIRDTINFSEQASLAGIKVHVDITHTYIGDLRLVLIAPSGTSVVLHNRSGGPVDNIQRSFDLATTQALSTLVGQAIQGNWTLHIQDLEAADVGKLNRWELEIQGQ